MIYRRRSTDMTQTLMWVGVVLIVLLLIIAAFGKGESLNSPD